MGGMCSKSRRSTVDDVTVNNAPSGSIPPANGHSNNGSRGLPPKVNANSTPSPVSDGMDKKLRDPFMLPETNSMVPYGLITDDVNDGIPHLSRALSQKNRSTKSKQAVAKVIRL
ncbi:unnamed protein product [Prunus armeniaca]|uniref:Uncharacterized protein n=1 Tax=Prunus armeniaca TaxID=36596 RepID=A0A6J5VND6_PRUAR|nr:unnamed protein product [Prunus armeniaca]